MTEWNQWIESEKQELSKVMGRLERHSGREQVQSIVEGSKALEQAERANKRLKHTFEISR